MKIEEITIPIMSIEEFAKKHDLTMEIRERPVPDGSPLRFYASFKDCEVKDGPILASVYGDGATRAEAISNYSAAISLKRLFFGAYTGSRREISPARIQ